MKELDWEVKVTGAITLWLALFSRPGRFPWIYTLSLVAATTAFAVTAYRSHKAAKQ